MYIECDKTRVNQCSNHAISIYMGRTVHSKHKLYIHGSLI